MGSDKERVLYIPVRVGFEESQFAHSLKSEDFMRTDRDRVSDCCRPEHVRVPNAPTGILEQLIRVSHFLRHALMVRVRVEKVALPGALDLLVGGFGLDPQNIE